MLFWPRELEPEVSVGARDDLLRGDAGRETGDREVLILPAGQ